MAITPIFPPDRGRFFWKKLDESSKDPAKLLELPQVAENNTPRPLDAGLRCLSYDEVVAQVGCIESARYGADAQH